MDVLGQFLQQSEPATDAKARAAADLDRHKAAEAWQLGSGKTPEARLLAFDRWVRIELAERLEWAWAGAHKERRIEQCRIKLESVVLDLWRRGWMIDGHRLAARITELLNAAGKYQRAGKVADFWAYFGVACDRYVGANAEEIRDESMRAGAHVSQLLGALGIQAGAKAPALPELIAQRADEIVKAKAETLREKLSRARARQAACKADAQQPQLW